MHPKRSLSVNSSLERQLTDLIATRCSPNSSDQKIPMATARNYVPKQLTEWGKVQIYETGDRAEGRAHRKSGSSVRDRCFVRVCRIPFSLIP